MPLHAHEQVRDFRILLKGRFLFSKRLSYTLGYMYNGPTETWHFRQTGIMVDVPELEGNLFIGRTKEGFSTNKLMVGYFGWTIERAAANEAFLPILADGVKWTGRALDNRLVYNAGWFIDTWSETESFNKNDKQFAGRIVWLPLVPTRSKSLLHLAAQVRFADSNDGFLQYRSKPESFPAQSYAVDTGKFPAESSTTIGFEVYYRPGPLMFGSEYFLNQVSSGQTGDPFFHGGEVFASYLLTGEVHPYNERGAYFEGVSPSRSVFDGGLGAWELVVRGSYVDLDSGTITGGKFWRITPMVSWYLSTQVRLELAYGYSRLDRFGVVEPTHYIQSRLQFML
jgi:phosphate-selective porin OprO/OprP